MSIPEAIAAAAEIGAPLTLLTHLTHHTDHPAAEAILPAGVRLAFDGLRLVI
jgi:phosphoribosyl 1,2-cyclic phosphate phosphodiesterase